MQGMKKNAMLLGFCLTAVCAVFADAIEKINLMQPEFVLSVGDLITMTDDGPIMANLLLDGILDMDLR